MKGKKCLSKTKEENEEIYQNDNPGTVAFSKISNTSLNNHILLL
jgi:hypothetical protein